MKTIKQIQAELIECEQQLSLVGAPIMERAAVLKQELQAEYFKAFDVSEYLQERLQTLESSSALTSVEHDEYFHTWVRIDYSKLPESTEGDFLGEYLAERSVYMDAENDAITQCIGPCIIIDDEGIVYDQNAGKAITSAKLHADKQSLFKEIEEYMQRTGIFPSVVRVDRYGNPVGYVNTAVQS